MQSRDESGSRHTHDPDMRWPEPSTPIAQVRPASSGSSSGPSRIPGGSGRTTWSGAADPGRGAAARIALGERLKLWHAGWVTSRGVPLVARLHVDLQRAISAACPAGR